jgi:predicted dehydrogenase
MLQRIGIVGTGFVADLYMRSLKSFPDVRVAMAYDVDPARLAAFCSHWSVPAARDLKQMLDDGPETPTLILNLTNPSAHFEVSRASLNAGKHVYSEKPLATEMTEAQALYDLAKDKSLMLASAPCSLLGEAAQTLWLAVREGQIGKVRLAYAQLDDDWIPKAPYRKWRSESGAPWPYRDEFLVGCTLEHAGYYLTWLIAMFGSVERVIAASATLIDDKPVDGLKSAPDYSCATIFFKSGVVARLTCSIVAPHDHTMKIVGEDGILEIDRSWDNQAPIRIRRRHVIRRRLLNSPIARRFKIKAETHPKVGRWGAASMNFALGPMEMISALRESRPCRLSADLALHLNEVTLAVQNANGLQYMKTECPPLQPMPWARSRQGNSNGNA